MRALGRNSTRHYAHNKWQESRELALRVLELRERAQNVHAELHARAWAAHAMAILGDPAADTMSAEGVRTAEATKDIYRVSQLERVRFSLRIARGE
jgi:hypothetical protein